MNAPPAEKNRRVLVVDEDQSMHDAVRTSVAGPSETDPAAAESANEAACDEQRPPSPGAYQIDSAYAAEEAASHLQQAVAERHPYALAFVEAHPASGADGIETVARLWKLDPDLQMVISTADPAVTLERAFAALGESDRLLLLKRPFDGREIRLLAGVMIEKWNAVRWARMEISSLETWVVDAERVLNVLHESHESLKDAHVASQHRASELARILRQRTAEAVASRDATVMTLAKLAESRDPETGEHLERMQAYAQILAEYLSRQGPYTDQIDAHFLEDLHRSSPLHDIGKVGIPDEILLKPGPLTQEEFAVMKKHARIGAEALERVAGESEYASFLEMAAEIARHHHERFDGGGYPDGLRGTRIPLSARIVALADVFDALTSVRIYKDAVDPEVTRRLIEEEEGRHFDPAVVEVFRGCYDDFLRVFTASHGKTSGLLDAVYS